MPNAPGNSSIFLHNYSTPTPPLSPIVNSSLRNGGDSKIFEWNWLWRTRNRKNRIGFFGFDNFGGGKEWNSRETKDRRRDVTATAVVHRDLVPSRLADVCTKFRRIWTKSWLWFYDLNYWFLFFFFLNINLVHYNWKINCMNVDTIWVIKDEFVETSSFIYFFNGGNL